ncbi:hypothetical protein LJC46_00140 [Desulfovibrio sp. OttesenSCG-928-G15]|nr:hypothetical protein [Desulfovibrio sp. OttesenSCG-928-G15]
MQADKMFHPAQSTELLLAVAVVLYDKSAHTACLEHLSHIQSKPCHRRA